MRRALLILAASTIALAGCSGVQSSLAPAGQEAERIAILYWWMAVPALIIWVAVIALAMYYARPHEPSASRTRDRWLIVGSGVVFPIIVLTVLLGYGLAMLPPLVARAPEGSLLVEVEGEQWWWRVRYIRSETDVVELANEIRLPVNEPVQFRLLSDNVIHSFWIPSLGGKVDMIPGRTTYLALNPTKVGTYAGACAEYCGTSHGFMRFMVEVMERPAFDEWLAQQARPAAPPVDAVASRGRELTAANGCGACHTIRGTAARGLMGPDLTHVASRLTLAAATLPTEPVAFTEWLQQPEQIKPGVHMPAFGMLAPADVEAIAAYMRGLR
jgi:cytochrome c oxidase subunit 2